MKKMLGILSLEQNKALLTEDFSASSVCSLENSTVGAVPSPHLCHTSPPPAQCTPHRQLSAV